MTKKVPYVNRSYTTPPVSNPPTLQPDGTVTIGPIKVGVWATQGGMYRFVALDKWVESFTVKGEGKFMKRIKGVYDV